MAAFNASELPNPFTPMAFLPPDIAHQIQIGIYVLVGTMGAFVWDILSNLHGEFKLLYSHRIGLATASYFFARIWAFLYIFMSVLFETYPLQRCDYAQKLDLAAFAIAVPANSFLFFLRGRAIFNKNPYLVACFAFLWLTIVGSAIALPFAVTGGNIGPTAFCLTLSGKGYSVAIGITPLIHDTAVFLAISWRLFSNSHLDRGFTGNARAFVTGETLPRFSKAVLQDGQAYYLISVVCNLLIVIMFYNHKVAETYRTMFTVCSVMVTNAMASHVFRNTKFGYHKRIVTTSELTSRTAGGSTLAMHRRPIHGGGSTAVHITNITEETVDAPERHFSSKKAEIGGQF